MNNLQQFKTKNWKNLQTGNLFTREQLKIFFTEGEHLSKGEPTTQIKKKQNPVSVKDTLKDQLLSIGLDRRTKPKHLGKHQVIKTQEHLDKMSNSEGTYPNKGSISKSFSSRITHNKKQYYLGTFPSKKIAHEVYRDAYKKLLEMK